MIVLNVNKKLKIEIEYRHATFPRINGIPCFFGITETDIAVYLCSYYQDKDAFWFAVKHILTENIYPRKDSEDNHMSQNKNISAKWEVRVISQRL